MFEEYEDGEYIKYYKPRKKKKRVPKLSSHIVRCLNCGLKIEKITCDIPQKPTCEKVKMPLIDCHIQMGRLFHIFHLSLLRSGIVPKDMRIYISKFQRKYLYIYYNSLTSYFRQNISPGSNKGVTLKLDEEYIVFNNTEKDLEILEKHLNERKILEIDG